MSWACSLAESTIHVSWCDAVRSHIPQDLNTSNYYFTSYSLSVCFFRSDFRLKLLPQWQWKSFSPLCCLTCLFKLIFPVNAFQHNNTQSHFTTMCHKVTHKVPSVVERFWHVARVYSLSPVWILKLRLSAFWVIKRLLHIEHWWGWSFACILECLVKLLSVWSAQFMYGTNMVSLQYVFSRSYPNLDLFWRPPHTHSARSYHPCVTLCADLNSSCTWTF